MGASRSKMEDDKALQLCHERKKFVRQALDGRCSLAAAHVSYVQSLKNTGTTLRRFIETEAPIQSSLYTSTNSTADPIGLPEKTLSQFPAPLQSVSRRLNAVETFSSSPSPPSSCKIQAKHMKFSSFSSRKVKEKSPVHSVGIVTSSGTPQHTMPGSNERAERLAFDDSSHPVGNQPWDYFGLFDPVHHQFSFMEGKGVRQEMGSPDDITRLKAEEKDSSHGKEDSQNSEDEFGNEPDPNSLVQRFENLHRVNDKTAVNESLAPTKPLTGDPDSEVELMNGEKGNSPNLSPLGTTSAVALVRTKTNKSVEKENHSENKVAPKDLFSSMKDIEFLFTKASESGMEVPKMLGANKLHFRPIFPAKERESLIVADRPVTSLILKACFSCGEDLGQVPEEPSQNLVKYLTWHGTESSRSSSSRNPLGENSKDGVENITSNIFDNFCMISGSHASTLDRLYAWERKLYDEVKASGLVSKKYDMKCKILRRLESKGEKSSTIDKTRAVVKDLHSRIRVAIQRIESISKRIEELRDKELQPQLEELIEGSSRMWEVMSECHKLQFQIMSTAYCNSRARIAVQSELRRQMAVYLENELHTLQSSFSKWTGAQKFYLEALNGWLYKCVSLQQKSSNKRKRRLQPPPFRNYGPLIYATCGVWLEKLDTLPSKDVTDSIKSLASEIARFLPHQEKNQGKGANNPRTTSWKVEKGSGSVENFFRDDTSEERVLGLDQVRASLIRFLGQLTNFARSSVNMYAELTQTIHDAKSHYHR
ncbi:protein ALTERED PHOSPHATE STARVATION RESPONSE 1-like [Prosopis cineraria]|uniref:protein ALTERED PHOSPHATE STARVATION RESPONSE 1-like n=1 Tax=Prosopis cineraria TaxID=364024 RepID=UPI00240FCF0B|nr:protein ALTERED PHOSPHATE STARVATION RESPONSE 1-like [Prosopis cineraria]XP_054796892.1 protein ALTERED PHOSPHATE STARVATION RESPONSE 1-like [Prosopis cineraria]